MLNENQQQDSFIHDVNYKSFNSILCLNKSQKSQKILIQRSLNDVRMLRDQKNHCAEFSFMQQHFFLTVTINLQERLMTC